MNQVCNVSNEVKLAPARPDVNDSASTAVGDSDTENLSPASVDGQVVIKSTFLDVEECPSLTKRFRTLRKSKTDSELCWLSDDEEAAYEPGRFSDEKASESITTPALQVSPVEEQSVKCEGPRQSSPERLSRAKARRPATICLESALRCDGCASSPQASNYIEKTTVMLRNVPNNYTREMFLAMLDDNGFCGRYDFAYLPCDFHRRANLGYAFVNFVNCEVALAAWRRFDGFSEWALPSQKVCAVSWSGPHQGLEQHVERYRNSPVMHKSVPDEYRPVVFQNGVRQRFPSPTRSLKEPDQSTAAVEATWQKADMHEQSFQPAASFAKLVLHDSGKADGCVSHGWIEPASGSWETTIA
eukprot:CAMPEP_0181463222 /NCGR_PEP_ID=MMETSP1110-20121109/34803_1 /TAXON_ID=174948 /ORGANISM="Symbiodinium sp., Strain CCMP421" /LENGTH=356 /DNA_ID=CAMNT_0023587913 /DNA_START=77 /DNA_END=1145 /DNA_ORIENTATION=+